MLSIFRGILSRHALKELLVPFACCFFGFLGLFLILDLHDDLGDFSRHKDRLDIVLYFLFQQPERLPIITPMALLLSVMYTFANLSRNNEITAIRSSGIPLKKFARPVIAFGIALSSMLYINNELLLPKFSSEASKLRAIMKHQTIEREAICYVDNNDNGVRHWSLVYDENNNCEAHLTQKDKNFRLLWTLTAKKAEFSPTDGWLLNDVQQIFYSKSKGTIEDLPPRKRQTMAFKDFKVSPTDMLLSNLSSDQMSFPQILNSLKYYEGSGSSRIAKLKTMLYTKAALPLSCVFAVLIGIPLSVSNTNRQSNTMQSCAMAIGILIVFYATNQLFISLGEKGLLPAFVGGALPTIAFISWGIYSFRKSH